MLAVLVVVSSALVSAIITHFRAKGALLFGKFTADGHQANAGLENLNALQTAIGTIVHAILANHVGQANFTINQAFLAGCDAGCVGSCIGDKHIMMF